MSYAKGGIIRAPKKPPSDLEGWKQIVADENLKSYRHEDIVAAVQKLGPNGDKRLLQALMGYLSDEIMLALRKKIRKSRRNEGRDIIEHVHGQLIEAILQPQSADGAGMREAFWSRLKFRAIDAIVAEDEQGERFSPYKLDQEGRPVDQEDISQKDHSHESAYVEQILSLIPDRRKQLAFRLHMDGCPISHGKGTVSIAKALGVSNKTAGEWIKEVQDLLKEMGVTNEKG